MKEQSASSVVIGAFSLGVVGLALGVSQSLDGQISFCRPTATGCIEKTVPEWMPLEEGVTSLKRIPGAVGQKLVGAALGIGGFWFAMGQSRLRLEEETDFLLDKAEEEARIRKERRIQEEISLKFFRDKTLLEAAEESYAVLGPYHEALNEANEKAAASAAVENASQEEKPDAPPQMEAAAANTTSTPPELPPAPAGSVVLHKDSEQVAMNILDGLVGSRRSTLIVGGTGAGKSVTDAYLLTKLFARYPDGEYWAIAQKNDSFCGLDKKNRVVIFDVLDPTPALKTIDHIYSIYDKRRRLPESARLSLPPVRLILADWLSINRALEELKNEEPIRSSKYLVKLSDILFNGRELNVCLLVDLQSFNLAAIGIKADRNSRKNFNLVGLGNYSVDEFGSVNESYGVLANMIGSKEIVPEEEERSQLLADFKSLKQISQSNQRPIIFTTLEPARVALLPDLRSYKPGQIAPMKLEGYTPEYLEKILKLEFEIAAPERGEEPQVFNELHHKILTYLQGKGAKKPHDMQKSRPFESTSMSAIREAIAELVKWGKIISEGDDKYRLNG